MRKTMHNSVVRGFSLVRTTLKGRTTFMRLLRGVYPERDSSVASLPQNDRGSEGLAITKFEPLAIFLLCYLRYGKVYSTY